MVRLLVQFTEAQARSLRAESRRRKQPVAALVRESVEAHVVKPATGGAPTLDKWERATRAVGGFHSGIKDLGENHDKYLGKLKAIQRGQPADRYFKRARYARTDDGAPMLRVFAIQL